MVFLRGRELSRIFVMMVLSIVIMARFAYANPAKSGSTGLLTTPSADTLDAGNICLGVWCDTTRPGNITSTRMPISMTMGIGTFWEIYGSYPNLLLNNDEDFAGPDGTALLGMKFRFGLKRSDPRKTALDIFGRRHFSSLDDRLEGVTDVGVRLIQLFRDDTHAFHFSVGYIHNGDPDVDPSRPPLPSFRDELFGSAAMEYQLGQRAKATLELTGGTSRIPGESFGGEMLVGWQYYLSPHLTFNLGVGAGFNGEYPDYRILAGISTCQGIGSYIKPVPMLVKERLPEDKKPPKPVKIVPLSPLLVKSPAPAAASSLEVPVDQNEENVIIRTYGKVAVTPLGPTTPVVLPPIPQLGPTPSAPDSSPAKVESLIEEKALEYTQARMSGISPLYGVVYREETVSTPASDELKSPQSLKVYRKFVFPDVIFEYNSAELSPQVLSSLSEVAEILRADNTWKFLRIDGHTDNIGSVKYNMELSLKRAVAVANHLVTRQGIDPGRVFVKGFGKSRPIADNSTAEGRARNRRFEILLLMEEP